MMFGGAAFTGGSVANAPQALTTEQRCILLDAGLDASIARGPQTGPAHAALENSEAIALRNEGCAAEPPVTLTTDTPASVTAGSPIQDIAHVAGGEGPTGSVTFSTLPSGNCTGTAVFTSTATVSGDGDYTSAPFTPTSPGSYSWLVTYSGDANNSPASSACEPFTVAGATTLTTTTPATVSVGNPIHDTAHLSGNSPTGQIGFTVFNSASCTGTPVFNDTVIGVNGNGDYTSANFTPTAAGNYSWGAFYTGDAHNNSAGSGCEPFTVT